jgi:hypothetical protein
MFRNSPLNLTDRDIRDIVVKFSDKPATTLSGIVASPADGKTTTPPVVCDLSGGGAAWLNNGRTPRRFAQVTADWNGAFTITNLPPANIT